MDTRKIQKVGGGTYTVSLPKEWAESEDVTAGEVVNLHTHIDGLLVIQAPEREEDTADRVTIHVPHDDPVYLHQLLRAAYAAGSTEAVFDTSESFTDDQRRVIEQVASTLPGVTIIESSASRVTVRTLLDSEEVSIRQSVRQLQFIALSMHRDATAALIGDTSRERIPDTDDQADRLYAMIDRYVTRGLSRLDEVDALGLTRWELFELWVVARELERVADHAQNISAIATNTDDQLAGLDEDDLQDISRKARNVVEDAVRIFIDGADIETARRALIARDHVREEIQTLNRQLFESAEGDYRLAHVLTSVRRTAEHGGNIAELSLRSALRRGDVTTSTADTAEQDDPDQSSSHTSGNKD